MKKHIAIFCAAALFAVAGFSQNHDNHNHATGTTTPAPATEAIKFPETTHDFGKIPQGKPVTYVFTFENIGKDSLKLDNVQASCGCTTPEWNKTAVAPGTKSTIKVGYNAAAEGQFEKTITVYYNGGQTKVLVIKGIVWKTPDQSAPTNQALNVFKQ
ncbi:DUF1573 domain-containing protein [Lacibacter luteus]|uniref:DUF1573 domain-containing protein n=1 Tax=Lacibacter luteus TaxID=2508719 RepID=A0A4Q1CG10_9BACT|nr:DUF1573 domain-containing protein [Lacibacter luteus]RXK58710.1 DUF1573 domain-containing protein [Lacibacter luteus]